MIKNRLESYAQVLYSESMRNHTTYRIGGDVDYYIYPKDLISLGKVIDILNDEKIPFYVMGRGSNVLFGDKDFHGAIISLDKYINNFYFEEDGTLLAEAGCSIIALSVEAMKRSLTGMEWASGIPGSIGGCTFMNAGAYNSNMANIIQEVCVLRNRKMEWISVDECDFSYRHSIFQKHRDWSILAVRMKLEKGNSPEINDLMDSRRKRRMDAQPLDRPCAGSVFRNPAEIPAWKLVEQMGFRGYCVGGAQVSEKHCNFIINANNTATAQDVLNLIRLIQERAKEEYNIELITEVEQLNW